MAHTSYGVSEATKEGLLWLYHDAVIQVKYNFLISYMMSRINTDPPKVPIINVKLRVFGCKSLSVENKQLVSFSMDKKWLYC